jgi:probable phosphoglycerate mutase
MTTFYLIRHGDNDVLSYALAGRGPGVHLNANGQQQALRLAEHMADRGIDRIFSSPMERARETAEPLARKLGLKIEICEAITEINYGDWTGKTMVELEQVEGWKQWNTFRTGTRPPGGESILEVQARTVGQIEKLRRDFPNSSIALFSHGDPLRSTIVYYLGMPLDLIRRLKMNPASVTVLTINDWTAELHAFNLT